MSDAANAMANAVIAPTENQMTEAGAAAGATEPVANASAPAAAADVDVDGDIKMVDADSPSNDGIAAGGGTADKAIATSQDHSKAVATTAGSDASDKPSGDGDIEMKDAEVPLAEEGKVDAASNLDTAKDKTLEQAKTEAKSEAAVGSISQDAGKHNEVGTTSTSVAADSSATALGDKSKGRRKSGGIPEHKGKRLSKKASKAKMLHTDAKPGDHFFAKMKGFPPWPVVVCDESMLPATMLASRPVSALRTDGSYREDFADGGKRESERTFPVMYLHTNEFSWTRNSDLEDLDPTAVSDLITSKMRKDLQEAHKLASENNDLDYYKQVLSDFELARQEALELRAEKAKAKKDKDSQKSSRKSEAVPVDENDDIDMPDADKDDASHQPKKAKPQKRKAEEETNVPQRSESVKKPKIKLTTSSAPKNNGVQSPKEAKEAKAAPNKAPKPKKSVAAKDKDKAKEAEGNKSPKPTVAPKEPELTAEERHQRKEKEILFLRHRLQKGLLNRELNPREDEMIAMSDFLSKLETFPELEVSIIRATKINKVLKAIIKLDSIPKEIEYHFKARSQALLDQWNQILANESGPTPANGVNGHSGDQLSFASKAPSAKQDVVESRAGETGAAPAPASTEEHNSEPNSESNGEPKTEPKEEVSQAIKAVEPQGKAEPAEAVKHGKSVGESTSTKPEAVESSP